MIKGRASDGRAPGGGPDNAARAHDEVDAQCAGAEPAFARSTKSRAEHRTDATRHVASCFRGNRVESCANHYYEALRLQPLDVRSAAKPVPGVEHVPRVEADNIEVEGIVVDQEHDCVRGPALFRGRLHESDARVDPFAE